MNMPMPPQGGPAPAPEGPDVGKVVSTVGQGLEMLMQMLPPEAGERLGPVLQEYTAIVKELAGGAPKGAPGGQAPQNAGGNPRAVPV